MKLTFIGADHEVTGSCHCIEVGDKCILVDYGMEQGANAFENAKLPVEEACVDYVLLTHAHVDHSGMLPLLYAKGFRGQVFTTEASADLCEIMLRDCAHIQAMEAEWKNRKSKRRADSPLVEPVYTMEDAEGLIQRIVPCRYDEIIDLCEGVKIRFTDVGHLLGSASIEVWLTEGNYYVARISLINLHTLRFYKIIVSHQHSTACIQYSRNTRTYLYTFP